MFGPEIEEGEIGEAGVGGEEGEHGEKNWGRIWGEGRNVEVGGRRSGWRGDWWGHLEVPGNGG